MNGNENVIHRKTAITVAQKHDSMNTLIDAVSTLINPIEFSVKNAIVPMKVVKNGQHATRDARDHVYEIGKIKKNIHHLDGDGDEEDLGKTTSVCQRRE